MAYDLGALFTRINHQLHSVPCPSLEELSDRLQVERHTIEKAVREATGRTFRDVRSRILLEHAKTLLGGRPNQTIKEVAFQLGYQSPRSFCRFVKATSGCSPKEFRKMIAKAGSLPVGALSAK
jgi:AraC-like DNA-binding protein